METKIKILITGANGFIGRNLVKGLKEEYDVTPLIRQEIDLINKEAVNKWFENKSFDIVIHCAIVGGNRLEKDEEDIIYKNLSMIINLMNNSNKFKHIINFTSGAEDYKQNTFYGKSKKLISSLLYCYHEKNMPDISNVKIYNVFGEDELETRFIKANILRYIKKEPIIIHQNGEMDFFYIEDLITLVKSVIDHKDRCKECCYENKHLLTEVAEIINNLNNYQVPVKIENPEYFIYSGDSIEIPGLMGLEEGIKKVYNKLKNEF